MAVVGVLAKEICQFHSSIFAAFIPVVPSEIGSLAHGSRTSVLFWMNLQTIYRIRHSAA